ncbi:hypothetical protein Emed_002175 [Eimeria media]
MAPSKFILFSAASLLLLDSTTATGDTDRKVVFQKQPSCITTMNATRQAAALGQLGDPTESSTTIFAGTEKTAATPDKIWVDVCKTLLDGTDFAPTSDSDPSGTYALYELGDVPNQTDPPADLTNIEPKCDAAVKKWQEAFSSFEADPHVDKPLAYKGATRAQVSFVTLYNPKSPAQGQCALAACTGTPQTTEGSPQSGASKKTVAGLVCFTGPTAFGGNALFTQDQWNNIKKVLSSSASTAVPSLMAVAALMFAAFFP